MTDPVLSVVIPSYNGRRLLATCLASIQRCRPRGLDMEVIVADDASTDETADWLARVHPAVRLVRLPVNGGFVAAANAGLAAARGEFIQLLNNDTTVLPGWAEAGLLPLADASVGAVAPLVLVRNDPARVDSAGDGYSLAGLPFKRGHGQHATRWASRPVEEVFGASASSAIYRAEALRRVGGFDPLYGSYYEDVDLAFRLRWAGYRCVYAPRCRILHDVSATYNHARPELHRRMARNAELLFWSNLRGARLAVAIVPHLVFLAAQAVLRLKQHRLRSFLAGKLDALRLAPEIGRRRCERTRLVEQAERPPRFPISLAPVSATPRPPRRAGSSRGIPAPHADWRTRTGGVRWPR